MSTRNIRAGSPSEKMVIPWVAEHARYVEPNRNGAHKRVRQIHRRMKEYDMG